MDESIVRCFLTGLLLLVVDLWLLWFAGWLNRVELWMRARPLVDALGLQFEAEGLRARVYASGTVGGAPVRVGWIRGLLQTVVRVRVGDSPWETAPEGVDVEQWLRSLGVARG